MQALENAEYGSVAEFVASLGKLRNNINRSVRDEYATGSCYGNGAEWLGAGCTHGKDVQRLMRDGWKEGRERMQGLLDGLDVSDLVPMDTRRRLTRAPMGDALDITAVYAGRLDTAWTVARRRSAIAPQRLDIVANMIASAFQDSDVLYWRGACAVALADKMESAGYMVRLTVGFGGNALTSDNERVSCRIVVKDYDMPLDISTASTVLLPGFFRALGHGWIAGHARLKIPTSISGVGQCRLQDGERFISHDVMNEATAKARLQGEVNRLNASVAA